MSIESKAKTRKDLQVFTIEKGHWIEPYSILDNQLKEKYISLEDAQKEIEKALDDQAKAIHKDWNRAGREWHKEENELKAKIEAANEKLAEITQNREYQCFAESALIPCKANCARGYEKLCDQITELTVILANQIPRKEEAKTI